MRWIAVGLAICAAGCGSSYYNASSNAAAQPVRMCTRATPAFRTCLVGRKHRPTIERSTASGWLVVAGPLRPSDPAAEWGDLSLSPDGRMLLADWLFPCDSAVAVFVPLDGGKPRVVTGQLDWREAPLSSGLGWTRDGKARVRVFGKRGVQLIDPSEVRPLGARPTGC